MKYICVFWAAILLSSAIAYGQFLTGNEPSLQAPQSILSAMPLSFAENRGQFGDKTLFKAEAGGATFYFCRDEVAYLFTRNTNQIEKSVQDIPGMPDKFSHPRYKQEAMLIKAQFVGTNPEAEIVGENRLSHNNNYFYSNDASKWRTDVPNWSSVVYKNIYPGIDLKYHGDGKGMKYDFIVNPGADLSQIRIRYDGINGLSVSNNGDLEAQTTFGPIHENIPSVYQEIGDDKVEVTGNYIILGPGVFGFHVEEYNPSLPLVIDPELVYSTYLGGSDYDYSYGIAVDSNGNVYVGGVSWSSDFPLQNPYQNDQLEEDVILAKLSADGSSLIYSTYIGGGGSEDCLGLTVDGGGNAYITGLTSSSDFPTVGPFQTDQPDYDAFISKLSADGSSLVYSTYLGGNAREYGYGIAVDGNGAAYITGWTASTDYPVLNSYQTDQPGIDVFVTKFSPSGAFLEYSTYLGGADDDEGFSVVVNGNGNAYVCGKTSSTDFPTINQYQADQPDVDAFAAVVSADGGSLIYSTYLGGSLDDYAYSNAIDGSGNTYLTGFTGSSDFPTLNPIQTYQSGYDAYVTKLSPSGSSLIYGTFVGGNGDDWAGGIAVDESQNAYITGATGSTDFPTSNSFQGDQLDIDAFVAKLSPGGDALGFSTYLGGDDVDQGQKIAIDLNGGIYISGLTISSNFPTLNAFQLDQGLDDIFITKFSEVVPNPYLPGDANGNGTFNGIDVTYSVNFLKGLGRPPLDYIDCPGHGMLYAAADANGNCAYNGIDVTYSVNYLKGLGPAPRGCVDCPPAR